MSRLAMTRGDSAVFTVTLTDEAGDALNLAGLVLTFTAKRRHADADEDAVFQKTVGAGITVTNEAGGVAEIAVDPEDTAALGTLRYLVWDLQVEDGTDVRTPLSGRLVISPDVTRGTGS